MHNGMQCEKILSRIEALMGSAKIGIDIIDSDFNIRYIDPAWQKVYGDPAGKKCYQYFMGRREVCPHCGILKALKTKKITITEEALAKEGNRPIQVTTIPFQDENGEWLVAETNVDISRIKQAEETLRQSENKYRLLFEKSVDAIFIADPKTRITVDCNVQAEHLTGYSRAKLLSMRADQLPPKDAKGIAMENFRKIAAGSDVEVETEILTKNKKRKVVSIKGTPIMLGGKPCMMGIFRDITERKRIEKALRESENKYRRLFEESDDAIFVADTRTKMLTDCNKKAEELTGYSRRKLLSMCAPQLHPKDLVRSTMKGFKEQVRGIIKNVDSQVLTRNGKRVDVSISASILEISGRKLLLGVFRDITERKKAEDVLKRDKKELAQLVESRSGELLKARDALSKAKRLSDIGLLASTLAHGLRSPFAAIRTAAYNIKKKSGDRRLKSHLANIDKKILESDQIIKNLLFYSHIKVPQRKRVVICPLIEECVKLSKEIFRGSKVSLGLINRCPKNRIIEADPVQLTEVFNNVLNNAYESFGSRRGKIRIWIRCSKKWLKVSIKDNGQGIGSEDLKKIFEPFFSTKAKGIGLGLPLCHQIIDLHNGKIEIASKIGKGTTVTIMLPLGNSKARTSA